MNRSTILFLAALFLLCGVSPIFADSTLAGKKAGDCLVLSGTVSKVHGTAIRDVEIVLYADG